MGNKKYPAIVNIQTQFDVSEQDVASMISTILIQKYTIPIGDFDMETYKVKGRWVIGTRMGDEVFDDVVVADCGERISIVSYNEDAALLFDAVGILEKE